MEVTPLKEDVLFVTKDIINCILEQQQKLWSNHKTKACVILCNYKDREDCPWHCNNKDWDCPCLCELDLGMCSQSLRTNWKLMQEKYS